MGEILTNSTFVTEINKIITKLGGTPSDISLTPDQANDIVNNDVFASKINEVIQRYNGIPTVITLSDDEANDMVNKEVFSNKIDELSGVISRGGSFENRYGIQEIDCSNIYTPSDGTITFSFMGMELSFPMYRLYSGLVYKDDKPSSYQHARILPDSIVKETNGIDTYLLHPEEAINIYGNAGYTVIGEFDTPSQKFHGIVDLYYISEATGKLQLDDSNSIEFTIECDVCGTYVVGDIKSYLALGYDDEDLEEDQDEIN